VKDMLVIRPATLRDAPGITAVHCSDIVQWLRHGMPAQYNTLSLFERWAHGGPWMSVETCTIHINNLLLAGHLPLVAECEGSIVGEAEIYFGREPKPFSYNANISVFYIHRNFQGGGIGARLMQEAIRLCIDRGCHSITVHNPAEEAMEFYRRCGFSVHSQWEEYVVKTENYPVEYKSCELPPYERLAELSLLVGRYQGQRESYDLLRWEQHPGAFALPGLKTRDNTMNIMLPLTRGQQAFVALRPVLGSYKPKVYIFAPYIDQQVLQSTLAVAHNLHFGGVNLLLEQTCRELIAECRIEEKRRGQKVLVFSS